MVIYLLNMDIHLQYSCHGHDLYYFFFFSDLTTDDLLRFKLHTFI